MIRHDRTGQSRTQRTLLAVAMAVALVFAVPLSAQVPTPADIIGFAPGTDYKLSPYGPIAAYFEALAASTDRMVLEQIGESTRGEPLYLAAISTPENLHNRERYKEITRTLAYARDPRAGFPSILAEDEARALAAEGKAIVWIDGGLHATEVAHGQVMPEMAHYFVTDESPETQHIRENAIVLLMANMNPDGLNIVADWYMSNVGGAFEMASVPELYHHYVGHDNNRDWYMLTQVETQAVTRQLYHNWFPQIVYNQHQSSPFPGRIWMPPFADPVNPNLDPLLVSSLNQMGQSMRMRFDVENKPGVNSGITFDLWWNGSMRGGPDYHNMLGFLTETAGAGYATPRCYDEIPETFGARNMNMPTRSRSTNYNNPWLGGCWHLRDAMDYMMTAAVAVASTGAKQKEDYLFNQYWMGRRQIERGMRAEGGPFAYVLDPMASHDPSTVVEFMELMSRSGIEFVRSDRTFRAGGRTFAAGSYVLPPQAFRPYVVDLMEPKEFPDRRQFPGGPPIPPYDMTGYELRYQMGLEVANVDEPFEMPTGAWGEVSRDIGRVSADGPRGYVVHVNSNWLYRGIGDHLRPGTGAFRLTESTAGIEAPAGSYWLPDLDRNEARRLADEHGLTLTGTGSAPPDRSVAAVRMPRVAIYRSYQAQMPEGWTRWVLDQYGFEYANVWDEDVRGGALSDFDVLVVPSQSERGILDGHSPDDMPAPYAGGLGDAGTTAIRTFVEQGGWVVAFDNAVDYAINAFDLPFRNAVRDLSTQDFFLPGSIIRLEVAQDHPLTYGLATDTKTLFARSQVLERTDGGRTAGVTTPVCYAREDYLVSGWTLGGDTYLAGRTAVAMAAVGEGQVVLFGFQPHFRGQPRGTFKLLFNALVGSSTDGPPAGEGLACR
ncbi:MAG: M14 family metallopeptidase [Gemmatimonadota bacterium]|nr:M14 family metallopeptidase [Gemmatimonadota bacterium]